MTLEEVKQTIARMRAIDREIEKARNVVEEYRTRAEGLQSPQYGSGAAHTGRHDGFENRVIEYIEKAENAQIEVIELSFEQLRLYDVIWEEVERTEDDKIRDTIDRFYLSRSRLSTSSKTKGKCKL